MPLPVTSTAAVGSVGASRSDVREVQRELQRRGFKPGTIDGLFGAATRGAVKAFQRANGLPQTGVVSGTTAERLLRSRTAPAPTAPTAPSDTFEPHLAGSRYRSRGTGYYPHPSRLEGGYVDRRGARLNTLQDFLAGRAPFVSVAMDKSVFSYGTKLRIPELERKYGRQIEFRVVDTGGAFRNKGTSRIDICTANNAASLDPTINGPLTLVRG